MASRAERAALRSAFYDTALTLFGVFDLYDAPAPLREAAAESLGRVFHDHLWSEGGDRAPAPLHDLMTELELAMGAGEEENE